MRTRHERARCGARIALATVASGALCAGWPTGVAGQTARTALPTDGVPLSAAISQPGEIDEYALTIARKGTYTIVARGAGRLALTLLGPDGLTEIESDPDAGVGSAPAISRGLVPGSYVVRVSPADPAATGTYRVSAVAVQDPPPPLRMDGPSVPGAIDTPLEVDEYSLTIARAGRYAVGTTGSTDLVGTLTRSGRAAPVSTSDDDGPGSNPLLVSDLAPGRYVVRLRHTGVDGAGRYRVAVRTVPPPRTVPLPLRGQLLGAIGAPEDVDQYRLRIVRPGRYQIATTGRVDVVATLLDSSGNRTVAEDDDGGPGLNPLVDTRLARGTYLLRVTWFDGRLGRYSVSARLVPDPVPVTLTLDAPTLQAAFSGPREDDDYRLVIPAAGFYEIGTAGDTDVFLTLLRRDRRTAIARDDDDGPELNALIRRRLTAGVYFVRAINVDREDTGDYGIFARRATP